MFLFVDESLVLHIHFGMSGKFQILRSEGDMQKPPAKARLCLRSVQEPDAGSVTCYVTAMRLDLISSTEYVVRKQRLGPDPLRDDADRGPAIAAMTRGKRTVAALLLDQSVLSGIGIIYRSEILCAPSRAALAMATTLPEHNRSKCT